MRKILCNIVVVLLGVFAMSCAKVDPRETATFQGGNSGSDPKSSQATRPLFMGDTLRNACALMGQNVHCGNQMRGNDDPCQTQFFVAQVAAVKKSGYDPKFFPDDPLLCKLSCIDDICQYPPEQKSGGSPRVIAPTVAPPASGSPTGPSAPGMVATPPSSPPR